MKRIAIAAASALLLLGSAQAQTAAGGTPWYGELGYTFQQVEAGGTTLNPQALRGIIGYNIHRYFALEGMVAFGTASDDLGGIDFKVDNAYGLFVKPKYDYNQFEVFGRLGWVHTHLKANGFAASASSSDSDFAYGVGVNYSFNPRVYMGLDYLRQFDKDSVRIDGWTISVGYRF